MQHIRAKIKSERLKQKLSGQKLADLTDTTKSQILNFENGKANITISLLDRICNALKLKLSIK